MGCCINKPIAKVEEHRMEEEDGNESPDGENNDDIDEISKNDDEENGKKDDADGISLNLGLSIRCYEDGQYEEAIVNGKKCLQMAIENGNNYAVMNAFLVIGESELALKEYENAVQHCKRSMEIASKTGDKVVKMKTSLALGEVHCALGHYDKASVYALRCIDIVDDEETYCALGEYEDVISYCMRARNIAKLNEDKHVEMRSCLVIAEVYRTFKKYDEAIEYAWKCIDIAKETADKLVEMEACLFLTETYIALGECERENTILCSSMLYNVAKETDDKKNEKQACFVIMKTYESLEQYKEAVQYAKMYLEFVKETGDKRAEMVACNLIAHAQLEARNFAETVEYGMLYADVAKEIGDKRFEIDACLIILSVGRALKSYDDIIQYATKRMTMGQETGDQGNKKIGCFLLGFVNFELENYDHAFSYLRKAVDHAKEEGDEYAEMFICYILGVAHYQSNHFDDAVSCCERSLQIAKKIGEKEVEIESCLQLSYVYALLNRSDEVESRATIALEIAKELNDKEGQKKANLFLGNVYRKSNQESKAIACLNECAEISKESGDYLTEMIAFVIAPLSNLCELRERAEKGLDIVNWFSLPLHPGVDPFFTTIFTLHDRVMSFIKYCPAANIKEASNYIFPYLKIQKRHQFMIHVVEKWINAHPLKAEEEAAWRKILPFLTEYELSGITFDGYLVFVIEFSNTALEVYDMDNDIFLAFLLSFKGLAHYLLEDIPNTKASFLETIKCFESIFDNLHDVDKSKISIVDRYEHTYKLLSKIIIEEGNTEEALLVAEHCRAKALKDILVSVYELNKEELQESCIELDDIFPVLKTHNSSILFYTVYSMYEIHKFVMEDGKSLHFSVQSLACTRDLEKLIQEVYVELDLRYYFRCDSTSSLYELPFRMLKCDKYREILKNIGIAFFENRNSVDGMNLEECIRHGVANFVKKSEQVNKSASFLEDPGNSMSKETSATPKTSSCCETYTIEGESSFTYTSALEALSQTLLGNVSLEQDEVVIIPDGLLSIVPFAALTNPATGRYLSEDKKIRFAPSLKTLKVLSESREDFHTLKGAIFIGDPDVSTVIYNGKRFGQLHNAEIEVTLIASKFDVTPLIGAQATKSAVLEKLHEGASVVHIAAHGNLDKATILLAPNSEVVGVPEEKDYMLTMADIQATELRAQLVVLSCCYSGRGEVRAEGVVGMCRAFLASGARAVVASLWAISDKATLEFMLEFYDCLQEGESASTSLQMAMKYLRNDETSSNEGNDETSSNEGNDETSSNEGNNETFSKPKYWAPFFLMGDDVKITF